MDDKCGKDAITSVGQEVATTEAFRQSQLYKQIPPTSSGVPGMDAISKAIDIADVTPPGGEHVVKALKQEPEVETPWAVAWAMKNRGEI